MGPDTIFGKLYPAPFLIAQIGHKKAPIFAGLFYKLFLARFTRRESARELHIANVVVQA